MNSNVILGIVLVLLVVQSVYMIRLIRTKRPMNVQVIVQTTETPAKQGTVADYGPAPVAKPAPQVEAGIPGEVVAAISAAVEAYSAGSCTVMAVSRAEAPAAAEAAAPAKKQPARPAHQGRQAWGRAGRAMATEPF